MISDSSPATGVKTLPYQWGMANVAFVVLTLVLFAGAGKFAEIGTSSAEFHHETGTGKPAIKATITIPSPSARLNARSWSEAFMDAAFALPLILFFANFFHRLLTRSRFRQFVWMAIHGIALLLLCVFSLGILSSRIGSGDWSHAASGRGPDGQRYHLLAESGFMPLFALTLLSETRENKTIYQAVEVFGIDAPGTWLCTVRPQAIGNEAPRSLRTTTDARLAVLVPDNECPMLYRPATGDVWTWTDDEKYRIETQNPFLLVDADDELFEPDVQKLLETVRKGPEHNGGWPSRDALRESLDHPNPRVRNLARECLDLMDK